MSKQVDASRLISESIASALDEIELRNRKIETALQKIGLENAPVGRPEVEDLVGDLRIRSNELQEEAELIEKKAPIEKSFFADAKDEKARNHKIIDLDRKESGLPGRYDFRRQIGASILWTVIGWILLYAVFALPLAWAFERVGLSAKTDPTVAMIAGFREYAARATGTVPLVCYKSDEGVAVSVQSDDWTQNGTPLLVQYFSSQPDAGGEEKPCRWVRNTLDGEANFLWTHFLASVSPDVGLIQKLSLFVLIFGWRLVRRAGVDMELTEGRLRLGRGRTPTKAQTEEGMTRAYELFPRRRLAISNDKHATVEQTANIAKQLDGHNVSGVKRLEEPYNVYCETLNEMRAATDGKGALRDSLWLQTLNYMSEIAEEGQSQRQRGPVSDRASKRADALREDIYRQFALADFVTWFLPTIGFLGTIYGISTSLVEAKSIFNGGDADPEKFATVVDALGTAFDTTAFALLLLAPLMFYKMRQEAKLSATADDVVRLVRTHLVNSLRDHSDGLDTTLMKRANNLIAALTEYKNSIPTPRTEPDVQPDQNEPRGE